MKRFHCDRCENLVVLENDLCTSCGSRLAFAPDVMEVVAWDGADPAGRRTRYRQCRNNVEHNVCNWLVALEDQNELCLSCRLTQVIPDLSVRDNLARWYKLEVAKRRLLVGLLSMDLFSASGGAADATLAFRFLADGSPPQAKTAVLTGHSGGVITVNIAEADDAERERRRVEMHEPYRTLVGHFRHEVGHYYWDRLIGTSRRLKRFRSLFGDERENYAGALEAHYRQGPAADWRQRFVSAYASSHPWEDWAETWAHYLHMVDSLETAYESGLYLNPRRPSDPRFAPLRPFGARRIGAFNHMIERWMSLTFILNDLNRGLGLRDAYPFVLSGAAIGKLEFVHDTIAAWRRVPRG